MKLKPGFDDYTLLQINAMPRIVMIEAMPQVPSDWESAGRDPDFKKLMAAKVRFVVPATIFFIAYYFALPILVGYAPKLMATPVIGPVNLAYLFALSQFFMAWLIAFLYVRAANRFDRMAATVLANLERRNLQQSKDEQRG